MKVRVGENEYDGEFIELFAPILERWATIEPGVNNVNILDEMAMFFQLATQINEVRELRAKRTNP